MKPRFALIYLWSIISFFGTAQSHNSKGNTLEFGDSSSFKNSIIAGGDVHQHYYYGLDSTQIRRIDQMHIDMALDRDSLVLRELLLRYNRKLEQHLAGFWQSHPEFNPKSPKQCIDFLESTQGKAINLFDWSSPRALDYKRCNSCVRDNPQDWIGVKVGGDSYYFKGSGLHTVQGYQGKNIGHLVLSIPHYGPQNIFQLREHHKEYWELVRNRETTLDAQYRKFLSNPMQNLDQVVSNRLPCKGRNGNLIVHNEIGEHLTVWLCPGTNGCSKVKANTSIQLDAGETGTFYELSEGVYSYESQRGQGLVYKHKSGQIRITTCEDQNLTLR